MEELLVFALLLYEEIASEQEYRKKLDDLFLEHPESDDLLYLEWETNLKNSMIYIRTHIEYHAFDYDLFGRFLMEKLKTYYANHPDIESFAGKMYQLWKSLPDSVQHIEPFFILSYADEPLSWGDEKQTRTIYEDMMNYYDN